MRKIIWILLASLSITIIGCDEEMFYDYVIHNRCDKAIVVEFETYDIQNGLISIDQGNIDTIYSYSIAEGTSISEMNIIFNSLTITNDTIESQINYLSNDAWDFRKKSDNHAVYYLEVDSTHF